jgi:hypothetical protein
VMIHQVGFGSFLTIIMFRVAITILYYYYYLYIISLIDHYSIISYLSTTTTTTKTTLFFDTTTTTTTTTISTSYYCTVKDHNIHFHCYSSLSSCQDTYSATTIKLINVQTKKQRKKQTNMRFLSFFPAVSHDKGETR